MVLIPLAKIPFNHDAHIAVLGFRLHATAFSPDCFADKDIGDWAPNLPAEHVPASADAGTSGTIVGESEQIPPRYLN
jgi:hypothetical protein